MNLGKWAAIDIETTGIDPSGDNIIDVGFLQFEGTKLIRKYSSLVNYQGKLSEFIKKLTGINEKMLRSAPKPDEVFHELEELCGHTLLAHNASFEESFLRDILDKNRSFDSGGVVYADSMPFLSSLFLDRGSLKLEGFIVDFGIAESEMHRGIEDSVDLLKVILLASLITKKDLERYQIISNLIVKYQLEDFWYYKFLMLDLSDLIAIGHEIGFDLLNAYENYLSKKSVESQQVSVASVQSVPTKFSGDNVKAILRDVERLNTVLPGYRFRDGQELLSLRVGQSFKNEIHSIVQAPTGTGKTLGYLIPAALYAMSEKKQVLIATGTKTLQKQAITKDIPILRKMLGANENRLKVKHLMGSGNHFCELLFRQFSEDGDLLKGARSFGARFAEFYFDLVFYHNARLGADDFAITKEQLPYVLTKQIEELKSMESSVLVDFRSCIGKRCPHKERCSYIRGIKEAMGADIIIGNHALMLTWPNSFKRPAYIVVDEAHRLESEVTNACSLEVTGAELEQLSKNFSNFFGIGPLFYLIGSSEHYERNATEVINSIKVEISSLNSTLAEHLESLREIVESYFHKMPRYTDQYWNEQPMIEKNRTTDTLAITIINKLESISFCLELALKLLGKYCEEFESDATSGQVAEEFSTAYSRFSSFVSKLEESFIALKTSIDGKDQYANSIKYHNDYGLAFSCAPINSGKVVHDTLLVPSSAVVFTSATLGNFENVTGVKGVEWSTGYLYLDPKKRFKTGLNVPYCFDYEHRAKLFLCDNVPAMLDQTFIPETVGKLIKTIDELGGKTLLLFSSKVRFDQAVELLLAKFEGQIPVLIQGMCNNCVEEFKKNEGKAVLVGMESFAEGIDIPGAALQLVFIDKIPDVRMDLVIQKRRDFFDANIGSEFSEYYLSSRALSLKQKCGRLLRTESDHGAIIVVDSRIKKWKGDTMETFAKLLSPYKFVRTTFEDSCHLAKEFICSHQDC